MTDQIQVACDRSLPDVAGDDGRAPYEAPRLQDLGDLRDVTLGVSRGALESGSVRTFRR